MRLARMVGMQGQIVWALALRELQATRGMRKRGYLSALLHPLIMLVLFVLLRVFLRNASAGFSFPSMAVGFLLFFSWRRTLEGCLPMPLVRNDVFSFPQISPFALFTARALIVWYLHIPLLLVLLLGGYILGQSINLAHWEHFLTGAVLMLLFNLSSGIFAWSLGLLFPPAIKIMNVLKGAMMWIGGVIVSASSMPQAMRSLMAYNPITVCLEMARDGVGITAAPEFIRPGYVVVWSFGLLVAGVFVGQYYWRAYAR